MKEKGFQVPTVIISGSDIVKRNKDWEDREQNLIDDIIQNHKEVMESNAGMLLEGLKGIYDDNR